MSLTKQEAWQRLIAGESPKRGSLSTKNGRHDLSGLQLQEPAVVEQWRTPLATVSRIEPTVVCRHVQWRDIDFSESKLNYLSFYESEIVNCCFDRSQLKELQLWATTIKDCSFRGADLRKSGLGLATVEGPLSGKRNRFIDVDLSQADLRNTVYLAAAFQHCTFMNTKLIKLGFGTSSFVDCVFGGELREVQFWRSDLSTRGFPLDAFPPWEIT